MLTQTDLRNLIHLEMPEAEALQLLSQLTPDKVTPTLLSNALSCMRETVLPMPLVQEGIMDCCGTGGSGLSHFNTSTTAAFVLAAAGVPMVKFGNRGFTSQCGSFDLLDQIGIPNQIDTNKIPDILAECNLVFLFAPNCYPKLGPLSRLRRQLKTRTLFNFLGPLLHPLKPAYRLMGVSHAGMQTLMAEYLSQDQASHRAWLVHGTNGLDEIAIDVPTRLLAVENGNIQESLLPQPELIAVSKDLGDSPEDNFAIFNRLVRGEDTESPYYQMVCLNAAAGLVVAGQTETIEAALQETQSLFRSGKVLKIVEQCRRSHGQFANEVRTG